MSKEIKKVNSFSDWKAKKNITEILDLPSGISIEVRKLNLLEQASCGNIPIELFNTASETSSKMAGGKGKMSGDEIKSMLSMIDKITVLSVVSPIVTSENVSEIPFDDKMEIFAYNSKINVKGAPDMESFRNQ